MTSIPNFRGALSEERIVAIVSRSAAVALAVVVVALVGLFEIEAPGGSLGAPVVNAVMLAPPMEAPPNVVRVQRPAPEAVVVSFAPESDGDAEWPHLWTYDGLGRIVFRTDEQLVRCTNARRRGYEQSDCPDSNDRTPMISREGVRYSENVRARGVRAE